MNLGMHLTAQQIESVGAESSKGEFEIDFWYILLQVLQRRNVYCIFTSKAVNENVFACILVVITVKIRIGLRK